MGFRTTIIGLGRIGSAIGLALNQTGANLELIGHDKDHEAARRAQKNGCVDRTEWNLINACDGADLVVVAIPLGEIRATLAAIGPELKQGCVVTDTAGLKCPVLTWAKETLPDSVFFVGGHPIVDKRNEDGSLPTTGLLAGATYCLTPATNTPPEALQRVSDLVEAVGAQPYFIDAAEHDGLIAAVEQLPQVLAVALQNVAGVSQSCREIRQLSGVDFYRVTRLLEGDPEKLAALCMENTPNVTRWLDDLVSHLASFQAALSSGDRETIEKVFSAGAEAYANWAIKGSQAGGTTDYSDFSMTHMMLGDAFRARIPPKLDAARPAGAQAPAGEVPEVPGGKDK